MLGLIRGCRNLARLVRIAVILARHDALFPLEPRHRRGPAVARRCASSSAAGSGTRARPGQRLAAAFTELGPSFIKLGQMLSTRADLLGDEIAADLAALQDRLPPFPTAQARALIEAEFGQPLGTLFCVVRRRAGRGGLDRAGSFRGHDRRPRRSRSRCCAPASPAPSRATSTCSYGWRN